MQASKEHPRRSRKKLLLLCCHDNYMNIYVHTYLRASFYLKNCGFFFFNLFPARSNPTTHSFMMSLNFLRTSPAPPDSIVGRIPLKQLRVLGFSEDPNRFYGHKSLFVAFSSEYPQTIPSFYRDPAVSQGSKWSKGSCPRLWSVLLAFSGLVDFGLLKAPKLRRARTGKG